MTCSSAGGPGRRGTAQCRRGEVHRRLGALPAARTAFEAALEAAPADNASLRACAGLGIARVALAEGRLEEARAQAETALASAESLRASVAAPRTRAATLEAHQGFYETLIEIRIRQHEREPERGHDAAALDVNERARARPCSSCWQRAGWRARGRRGRALTKSGVCATSQRGGAEQGSPRRAAPERMQRCPRHNDLLVELADA